MVLDDRLVNNGIIEPIKLKVDENGKVIRVTDDYIDISYKSLETSSKVLSNLYRYKFNYFGKEVSSIEAAIQSLKYNNEDIRLVCYDYYGLEAWHLRGMNPYSWQLDGVLYTPLRAVDRYSEEYQDFLDGLYYSVFQNPLYRFNLEQTGDKKLDHVTGENDINRTTLTRTEYISRLYALRYCLKNQLHEKDDVKKVFQKVRFELKSNV